MINNNFLAKIAQHVVVNYSEKLSELVIVLPNKRAKVFLLNELKNQISSTVFSPIIISIEDFVQDIANIRTIDSIELLFEFYEVYLTIEKENQDSFEVFANWAKIVLQDFNEIDRYLIDANAILHYLENIKEIEHWSLQPNKTELVEKHLAFWKKLPTYYHELYKHLVNKDVGYQGLIYREAKDKLPAFTNTTKHNYIFAGFNALNKTEEVIIQYLIEHQKAEIFWDIDQYFLNNPYHDAGFFIRKIKSSWKFYKNNPFQWIIDDFSNEKNIQIIGTPKSIGQAKIVGNLIEKIAENTPLQNTAIVLGDENLLIPVLYSLPSNIDALNITMGYSAKNNPVQLLISKLFKLHVNALSKSSYVFYYKDVLDVLSNPLIENSIHSLELTSIIKSNNFTFISHKKLAELQQSPSELFNLIFSKWDKSCLEILNDIASILLNIKNSLDYSKEEEKLTNAFVYAVYKVINKLINYFSKNTFADKVETLHQVYKQVIDAAEVSFEGEPLQGLQIMGVLESRVLDFDTVIITSVNEGKFPAGKSYNSFLPYDVKKEYELPTYKEKDAIYTYHFYHLLHRAKNIYLIYNIDSDGFDSGEKSRFITQLEVEKLPNHTINHSVYNAKAPEKANELMVIPKSDLVITRLHEIAQNGFSPSALTTYIRNPIQFYFQRILRISDNDEVEENIAVNTLGTIIHKSLEELYKPFIGRILTVIDIQNCFSRIDEEVLIQFKKEYKEGEIKKGKNLLAFEVAKRTIFNFLTHEKELLLNGDEVQIIALEKNFDNQIIDANLPFPITISGNIDRVELRNGKVRIIDYKTGKVEAKNVTINTWENFLDIKNEKIIQVLAYAFMLKKDFPNYEIEAGIISFKNLKSGFLPFTVKENRTIISEIITNDILENFINQMVVLINQILDKSIAFEEKT